LNYYKQRRTLKSLSGKWLESVTAKKVQTMQRASKEPRIVSIKGIYQHLDLLMQLCTLAALAAFAATNWFAVSI
jgi:hypothetical protein